jgi:hypothetical protein
MSGYSPGFSLNDAIWSFVALVIGAGVVALLIIVSVNGHQNATLNNHKSTTIRLSCIEHGGTYLDHTCMMPGATAKVTK